VNVTVKLFATFRDFLPTPAAQCTLSIDLDSRATVRHVLARLGIPDDLPRIVLINGHYAAQDRRLDRGDVVSIFPPLIGGR
jgi:molybdopterin converting factor small subunit